VPVLRLLPLLLEFAALLLPLVLLQVPPLVLVVTGVLRKGTGGA
jgi:hypothetical protein